MSSEYKIHIGISTGFCIMNGGWCSVKPTETIGDLLTRICDDHPNNMMFSRDTVRVQLDAPGDIDESRTARDVFPKGGEHKLYIFHRKK